MNINLKGKPGLLASNCCVFSDYLRVIFCLKEKNCSIRFLCFAFICFSLLSGRECIAAAGDSISNTATINYDIGGVSGSVTANSSFIEDRLINFTVSKSNDGVYDRVVDGMTGAVMAFNVLNTGNAAQDFLLTAVNTTPNPFNSPADNFNTLIPIRVFAESGTTPGYQPAQDTAVYIDELSPNAATTVYVIADIPAGLNTGDVAAVALIAQVAQGGQINTEGNAITNDSNGRISPASPASGYSNGATVVAAGNATDVPDSAAIDTVFNEPGGASAEDVSSALVQDVAGNGQHVDAGAYQLAPPVVINKSVTVIDTAGGSDPHPGATLRYQLDVSIAGNTGIDNLVITDPIPANTTYTNGSIILNGVPQDDQNNTAVDFSQAIGISSKPVTAIEVDLSQGGTNTVSPGDSNTILFEVTIN